MHPIEEIIQTLIRHPDTKTSVSGTGCIQEALYSMKSWFYDVIFIYDIDFLYPEGNQVFLNLYMEHLVGDSTFNAEMEEWVESETPLRLKQDTHFFNGHPVNGGNSRIKGKLKFRHDYCWDTPPDTYIVVSIEVTQNREENLKWMWPLLNNNLNDTPAAVDTDMICKWDAYLQSLEL